MIRSLTTTSADLKAASTSPPETFQWKHTLLGTSAWSCGSPFFVAFSASTVTPSGS